MAVTIAYMSRAGREQNELELPWGDVRVTLDALTCRRLVQEQYPWRREQLRGDTDTPLLTAGQPAREGVTDEAVRDLLRDTCQGVGRQTMHRASVQHRLLAPDRTQCSCDWHKRMTSAFTRSSLHQHALASMLPRCASDIWLSLETHPCQHTWLPCAPCSDRAAQ